MRLCTSTNINNYDKGKPYQITLADSLSACARAGYRYLDANLCGACRTAGREMAADDWESWIGGIREQADRLGVRFIQAHSYWSIGNSIGEDGSLPDGAWAEELMRRSVVSARILGVEWMVVHPYSVRRDGGYDYEKSFARNRDYYGRWSKFFEENHVGMAIENLAKGSYGSGTEQLLELVDAIGSPCVGICIDTGHANRSDESPDAMIRGVNSHLKATHIDDNHGGKDEHFAPFNGTIDWNAVMKALRDIDYQEAFAFEIHHLTSMYPSQVQQKLIDFSYELGEYLLNLA